MEDTAKVNKVIRALDELPTGWHQATLSEVAEITMGQSPSSQHYNSDGKGLPFFQGKAEFGQLYPEAVKWCTQPSKVAQKDNILISVRAPVGPTNLAPSKCCIGRGLAAIQPRDGAPSKYIMYYLRSIESDIDALGTGTTFKAISGGILRSIPIPVAPPAQQELIVAEIEKEFSRLDEAVASLKRVKANLKRYKAAVLKAAVEGKLTEEWRKAHPDIEPASKLLERILAERRAKWNGRGKYKEPGEADINDVPLIPAGWVWVSLDQLTSHITSGSRDWSQFYGRGTGTFVLAQNVRPMRLDFSERQLVDAPKGDAETERTRLQRDDLLVTIVGAKTGDICRVSADVIDHFVCQSVSLLRPVRRECARFVELYLASAENGQAQWKRYMYGQGRPHLSFDQLKMTPIPLPPLAEQQSIVAEVDRRLSVIEELEAAVNANLTRADRLRQAILKKAFSSG